MARFIFYCFLLLAVVACSQSSSNGDNSTKDNGLDSAVSQDLFIEPPDTTLDTTFCFVCRGEDREENFDSCPVEVTVDNVAKLYRLYEVKPIENCDLYLVKPDRLYTTSAYFSRLLRFEDGKQVAAITFYGWSAPYVFPQDNDTYMVCLNSLATTAGFNKSTFTCKSVLLDKSLKVISEREFRYKEQLDAYYAYVYFDTIIPRENGYDFRVINTGFDASDYFEYRGHLSKDNVVTESSKRNVKID